MQRLEKPKIVVNVHQPEKWDVARRLRDEMTEAEHALWEHLRMPRFLGLKFRRQQITRSFVVDFYCHEMRLAVGVDGSVHDVQQNYDAGRTQILEQVGVRVVRVTNTEALQAMSTVLARLRAFLDQSFPHLEAEGAR